MAEKNAQEVEKLEIELQQKEKVIASLRAEIRDLRCTTHRQLQELSAEEQDRALLQSEMVVVQANCDKLRQIIQGNQTGAERPWASETRVSPTFQAGTVTHETDSSVESLWEDRLPRAGAEEAVILKAQNQMLQRQAFGDHSDKLVYRLTRANSNLKASLKTQELKHHNELALLARALEEVALRAHRDRLL
ncbi:MAG: uncharacterized protein KVP18_003581 [Porospora cf. gigantea A]|uniref:uncharacterized protein n=1 Tax=Porospora cf. gigantea A TaxID=2853593 RepID=UPI003559C4DE|nr:MAG: hypothetical protein KVP18_003581 [Porospora cf. gigantea A]